MAGWLYVDYRESGYDMSGSSEIGRFTSIWLGAVSKSSPLAQIESRPRSHHKNLRRIASEAVVEVLYISSIMGLL